MFLIQGPAQYPRPPTGRNVCAPLLPIRPLSLCIHYCLRPFSRLPPASLAITDTHSNYRALVWVGHLYGDIRLTTQCPSPFNKFQSTTPPSTAPGQTAVFTPPSTSPGTSKAPKQPSKLFKEETLGELPEKSVFCRPCVGTFWRNNNSNWRGLLSGWSLWPPESKQVIVKHRTAFKAPYRLS